MKTLIVATLFSLVLVLSCSTQPPPADGGQGGGGSATGGGSGNGGGTATGGGPGNGGGTGTDGGADAGQFVELQILTISDWHAQLDPLTGKFPDGGNASIGGASALSAHFQREKQANPNTLIVTAGDAFGASPPLSGFFDEAPAVKALNLMGVQVDTFGNHNFDRGLPHLQAMIDLADYVFVSTNLNNLSGNLSGVVTPYHLISVGPAKVGIVGLTNPDAPELLLPGRMGPVTVDDLATSVTKAHAARDAAKAAGADIVIALVHMGVTNASADGSVSGPLIDIAQQLQGFAAVIGDHTDISVAAHINGQLVVENRSKGATYARLSLTVELESNTVAEAGAVHVTPYVADFFADGGAAKDPAIDTMLAPYRSQLSQHMDTAIGKATGVFPRNGMVERTGEAAIGSLVADAMRERYAAALALTNGGGLRSALPSSYVPADAGMLIRTGCSDATPCDLVRGDVFAVLPFGNVVITRTVSGQQLWRALEHGVAASPEVSGRFPQISGFTFVYDAAADAGSRVVSVTLGDGGALANDSTEFSFVTNDFTNSGGDGYRMFADGKGTTQEVMADVVLSFIADAGVIAPAPSGRIMRK
jgi:5'-nucleotidase